MSKTSLNHLKRALKDGDPVKIIAAFGSVDIFEKSEEHCRTALHYAVLTNKLEAVKILVNERKADLSAKDYKGRTPLQLATECNLKQDFSAIVAFLREHAMYEIPKESDATTTAAEAETSHFPPYKGILGESHGLDASAECGEGAFGYTHVWGGND